MRKSVILALAVLTVILIPAFGAAAIEPEIRTRFVAVAYHDVVDSEGELSGDDVTTDSLVVFFEWLRGNNWHPISLDDVALARDGKKSLPEKAILITFDDGYRSLYTRVYPLVLAYKFPIVAAITGRWMDGPMDKTVSYGMPTNFVPRTKFISWDEAREMQHSGLVEFASHSFYLHNRNLLVNPQGNRVPPVITRQYFPETKSYENEAGYRARMRDDMAKMNAFMARELGKPPRALVWPYGRYSIRALEEAKKSGYEFALTLDSEPASAARPFEIDRYLLSGNPKLGDIATELNYTPIWPHSIRYVELNPASIYSEDPDEFNDRLGMVIERLRRMGATDVLLDAAEIAPDGTITATWFPNNELPVKADILSRIDRQIFTRAGCTITLRLPHLSALATLKSEERVLSLYSDLGIFVPVNGILIEGAKPPPAEVDVEKYAATANTLANVRAARDRVDLSSMSMEDRLAWRVYRAVEYARPRMYLDWLASKDSSVEEVLSARRVADVTLIPAEWKHWDEITITRSLGLWISGESPPGEKQLLRAVRDYQVRGGRIIAWTPDEPLQDRPNAQAIAPGVSVEWFPRTK